MDLRVVERTGDHLHGVGIGPVRANGVEYHPAPAKQRFVGERFGIGPIEIDRHLCDTLLLQTGTSDIGCEAELRANGGLDAGSIQNLTFDFRRRHGFLADRVDRKRKPVCVIQVSYRSDEYAALDQEVLFRLT